MRKFLIKKMSLFLTEECDKKCFFCDIGKIEKPKGLDEFYLSQMLPYIDKSDAFYHYTITGGEPGLVKKDSWRFIFDTIKCHPIRINTNGMFFENGLWDEYNEKIWQIGLHVDLDKPIPYQIESEKVWYYVPVHKRNYKQFCYFVRQYPKLNFSIIPYIHKDQTLNINDYALDDEEIKHVLDDISPLSNVADCTKEMLSLMNRNVKSTILFRDACKENYVQPLIDFVNGRIGRCVFSYTNNSYRKLTFQTMDELLTGKLIFNNTDTSCNVCNECYRYVEYYLNNSMVKGMNEN